MNATVKKVDKVEATKATKRIQAMNAIRSAIASFQEGVFMF